MKLYLHLTSGRVNSSRITMARVLLTCVATLFSTQRSSAGAYQLGTQQQRDKTQARQMETSPQSTRVSAPSRGGTNSFAGNPKHLKSKKIRSTQAMATAVSCEVTVSGAKEVSLGNT